MEKFLEKTLHVSLEKLWRIFELFLNEVFQEILQTNTGVPEEIFKYISELFPVPIETSEDFLENFRRESMDKFLKNSQHDSQAISLVEFFIEEISGGIPDEILKKFQVEFSKNP